MHSDKQIEQNLHDLLDSPAVREVLGFDLAQALRYYLSRDELVGYDFRNKIAHWDDIAPVEIDIHFCSSLMFLFNCVFTTIFIKTLTEQQEDRFERRGQRRQMPDAPRQGPADPQPILHIEGRGAEELLHMQVPRESGEQ